VAALVTVGINVDSSTEAMSLAHANEGVYASVGVHPNEAMGWDDAASSIERALSEDCVVAVGESGLDYYRDQAPHARQAVAFRAHIALAKAFDKALVIHTRASVGAALDILEQEGPPPRMVWHCWSGDEDELRRALGMGSFVSFAGNLSFHNADRLRAVAALVPEDRLLIETDSPFLTPAPHRGKPNEPALVVHVGRALAELRNSSDADIARRTTANARRLFGLDR
jgi:TatD DNase family protein